MSAQRNMERLLDDMKSIIRHGEDLVRDIPRDLNDKLRDTREQFSKALDGAKVSCRKLEEKTLAGAKMTDEVIHEKPYQFIGAALGVGILIGVLVGRGR